MYLPDYIQNLLHQLESNGFQAFVVGGCVRNSLLGLTPDDWDICTRATPEEMLAVFRDYSVIPTGIKHGTVTVLTDDGQAEITTFRTDGTYLDSRHPESVAFVASIEEDLARRDFTVNAMAYSPEHGLIDPYFGQADLPRKLLRCVGDPNLRFQEDALRILRALRFSAVYDFTIEDATASAMLTHKEGLKQIARERIFSELKKILLAPHPGKILSRYPELLSSVFQTENWDMDSLLDLDLLPQRLELRLATLLQNAPPGALQSLKPDNETRRKVQFLHANRDYPLPDSLLEARQMVRRFGFSNTALFFAWKGKTAETAKLFLKEIQEKQLCCTLKELAISGKDLIGSGIREGKQIADLLSKALDGVIAETIPNEKKALMNYLFL